MDTAQDGGVVVARKHTYVLAFALRYDSSLLRPGMIQSSGPIESAHDSNQRSLV